MSTSERDGGEAAKACVIIPTLNEEAHIGGLLRQLLETPASTLAEVLVADGGSRDRTREIVQAQAAADPRVRLVDNPERIQSAGVNRAARESSPAAGVLLRIDAHASYPPDYVHQCLAALEASQADSVVVRLRTVGETCFQKAVAAASNSPIGAGGSLHRMGGAAQFVDHGHHAAFRRDAFLAVGGYDTAFRTNEDAEFDHRFREAGHRIWFEPAIEIDYWPRRTPAALARQYFRYGQGRAANVTKHRVALRPRQLLPALVTGAVVLSLAGAVVEPRLLLVPALYAAATLAAGAVVGARAGGVCAMAAGLPAMIMHLAWGSGLCLGLLRARSRGR